MRWRKVKVSQYNKLDEKDSVHIEMTKDSNGWKYKKLEDAKGDHDSSDSTTKDEHKKILN